jgi:hypothetical protein
MKGEIWNDVVTNKTKLGELYYVDTFIRALFDVNGKLDGFIHCGPKFTNEIGFN